MILSIKNQKKGYTLTEILIVVIVIGIIASLALPNLAFSLERSRLTEGLDILDKIRTSQIAYEYEQNSYADDISKLDVSIVDSKYFPVIEANNAEPIAVVKRIINGDEAYRLNGFVNGDVTCSDDDVATSKTGWCRKLGF